jgi:hypothetical protein
MDCPANPRSLVQPDETSKTSSGQWLLVVDHFTVTVWLIKPVPVIQGVMEMMLHKSIDSGLADLHNF